MGSDGNPAESATDATGQSDASGCESYYELLGVSEDATTGEIERAYRRLAKRHHPDASELPEAAAERRFRRLLTARDVLTDETRRRAYDELGHEEYRRQSAELGTHPRRTGDDRPARAREPEPRPEPGRAQRSARGEASRRGDPVVTDIGEALGGASGESAGETEATRGRGVYGSVFEEGMESRSLGYVAARWRRSWRNRPAVVAGAALLVAGVLAGLPRIANAAGIETAVPAVTATRLYTVALVAAAVHTAYACGVAEARLPRGAFLADRDHGRFSMATARRYRRRGVAALALALAGAVASARGGTDPWHHAAGVLRGESSGRFLVEGGGWTGALDAVLAGGFALGVVVGVLLLAVGVSIGAWRGRYERGHRVRPSLWEPVPVTTLAGVAVVLAAGPADLAAVPALASLPDTVALAAGIDGTTATTATVAAAGVVLSLASVALLGLRFVVAGGGE